MLHGSSGTLLSELFVGVGACVGLQVKLASSDKISAAGNMNTLISGPFSSSGSLPQGAAWY